MTAILCISSALLVCTPAALDNATAPAHTASVRGGAARLYVEPARGGHAEQVLEPYGPLAPWLCIHGKEAAWNDTGDPYWGGLQMDRGFMTTYGADKIAAYGGWADRWPPRDQMVVAWRAVVGYHGIPARGYGPWPNTRIGCA